MRVEDAAPRTWLLAVVAGWAVLAWVLALAGMGRNVGKLADDPALQPRLPQPGAAPRERLGPFAQYSEISARPLFTSDRRPKPFSLQPEGEGEAKADTFDYVLTSVLLTPRLRLAILQPSDGSESIRIKEGESSEKAANWRLVSLAPRSAVFEGPDGQRTLDLRTFDGQGGQPAAPRTAAAAALPSGSQATRVPRPPAAAAPPPAPRITTDGRNPATAAPPGQVPAPAPDNATSAPKPQTDANAVVTPEAQIEQIRQRIQARREQMRREAQQQNPPGNNP